MKIPLVLISGLLSNRRVWQRQVQDLSDLATICCIAPVQNTPQAMLREILENAPPYFALAGHSMGGWLSLEVMRAAPSSVKQLCLLNTTARMDSLEKADRRRHMIQQAQEGHFEEIVDQNIANFVLNPAVRSDVRKMFLEVGKEAFICQEQAMLLRAECQSILPTIACPTLVIHAAQDKIFTYEEHQELAASIPDARLAVVQNSGHMSPMEQPQAVTELLRQWLKSACERLS